MKRSPHKAQRRVRRAHVVRAESKCETLRRQRTFEVQGEVLGERPSFHFMDGALHQRAGDETCVLLAHEVCRFSEHISVESAVNLAVHLSSNATESERAGA
eukprot:scaffold3719_cov247-Pinguiococcus_pyrenoidosus.AAC.24